MIHHCKVIKSDGIQLYIKTMTSLTFQNSLMVIIHMSIMIFNDS